MSAQSLAVAEPGPDRYDIADLLNPGRSRTCRLARI